MPISGGKYVAPTWNNGSSPAINAAELQAMCDTIATNQNATFSQIVSYTGTGDAGSTTPCSITFSQPVDVIIYVGTQIATGGSLDGIWSVKMANESTTWQGHHGLGLDNTNTASLFGKKSADNTTYSWYGGYAPYQLNNAGQTYSFLGLSGVT